MIVITKNRTKAIKAKWINPPKKVLYYYSPLMLSFTGTEKTSNYETSWLSNTFECNFLNDVEKPKSF
jgi:hypothetical protein